MRSRKILFSPSMCWQKKQWFVCPHVSANHSSPRGFPSISLPTSSAISLDINGQCGRGRGLPSHSKNPTHLSHSELNIAALSCSDSAVVHQPPGMFGGKGPQKEEKGGSVRSLTDVRKGLERDQRKEDKHLRCASVQGEAMVYGIEASADSMCNSEKMALGEIYWRGVIKKEKETEIWPAQMDPWHALTQDLSCTSDNQQETRLEFFNQPPTKRHVTFNHAGLPFLMKTQQHFFSWKRAFYSNKMHIYIAEVTIHRLAQYAVPLEKRGMYTKMLLVVSVRYKCFGTLLKRQSWKTEL